MGGEFPFSPGHEESEQVTLEPELSRHQGLVSLPPPSMVVHRSLCRPLTMKGKTQSLQPPPTSDLRAGVVFVVRGAVAGILQVTWQPLAPAALLLESLVNLTVIEEVEVNTKLFLFPQTLSGRDSLEDKLELIECDKSYTFSSSSVEMTRVSPSLQALLFLMLTILQENLISAQVSSIW